MRGISIIIRDQKVLLMIIMSIYSTTYAQQLNKEDTFSNPIAEGADPWVTKYRDFYYVCLVDGESISVGKSKSLSVIGRMKTVWSPAKKSWNSSCVWAPELHRIGKKWYIYYAAGPSGPPYNYQRSGVLESVTDDPQGKYIEKWVLITGDDPNDFLKTIWAIDVTVATINNQLYAAWSGWEKNTLTDKTSQHLYMAKMSNPWTIDGKRVKISSPDQVWETGGALDINEGPQFLEKNGNVFIVYSTRESWLKSYCLGILRMKDTKLSPLDSNNWVKKGPVFKGTSTVLGVGHASFTTSPDGTEDWIFYHSKKTITPGWDRDLRLQKFTWDVNGDPVFGDPISSGVSLKIPSGEISSDASLGNGFESLKGGFEEVIEGKQVSLYVLKNRYGAEVAITNYGCRIVGILVPDENDKLTDVVLGFKSIKEYLDPKSMFFGPIIGRFANRLKGGEFTLDGVRYQSSINDGKNTLHGGKNGFFSKVWTAYQPNSKTLVLKYRSVDGEEGFPGNLEVTLTYSFNDENELKLDYVATTDKKTVINLTNHAYFNLNGENSGTIENHLIQINAETYIPVNRSLIPDGAIAPVKNTPFDFRKLTEIGSHINADDIQLKNAKGYDHNFVLRTGRQGKLYYAGMLKGNITGITMDIYTTEPGLQFYSGNFFTGENTLKNGGKDTFRSALALETQHFPDSPNQSAFPSTVLDSGEKFHSSSIYKFRSK